MCGGESGPASTSFGRASSASASRLSCFFRERPAHGYELLEQLPELTGERVDMGNLYRFLRLLEADGLVSLSGTTRPPARASGSTSLSDEGRKLLDEWAALRAAQGRTDDFPTRYEEEVNECITDDIDIAASAGSWPRPRLVRPGEGSGAAGGIPARPGTGARRRFRSDQATPGRRAGAADDDVPRHRLRCRLQDAGLRSASV